MADRQRDDEPRAWPTLDDDLAPVTGDEVVSDRQPESGPRPATRPSVVESGEALEELERDALAGSRGRRH